MNSRERELMQKVEDLLGTLSIIHRWTVSDSHTMNIKLNMIRVTVLKELDKHE